MERGGKCVPGTVALYNGLTPTLCLLGFFGTRAALPLEISARFHGSLTRPDISITAAASYMSNTPQSKPHSTWAIKSNQALSNTLKECLDIYDMIFSLTLLQDTFVIFQQARGLCLYMHLAMTVLFFLAKLGTGSAPQDYC
jgi:hypothetical protein